MNDESRDLATLPKAHLHLHLEAAMRPSTLASLAAKYDRPVPQVRGYGSFSAFVEMYVAATDVLRERSDWERLADEDSEFGQLDRRVRITITSTEPMRIAREGGLQITPHLGELDRGDHVATALDLLGVTRILHGVRSVEVLVGSTLLGEYELCRREFGFDDDQMAAIARTSIEFSSARASVKQAALGDIDVWLASGVH